MHVDEYEHLDARKGLGEPITMTAIAVKVGAGVLGAGAAASASNAWNYMTGSTQKKKREANKATAEAKGQEWVANTKHYYDLCFGMRNWFGLEPEKYLIIPKEKDMNPCACKDLIELYDEVKTTGALDPVGKKYGPYPIRINGKPIDILANPRNFGGIAERVAKKAKNCRPEQKQQRQVQAPSGPSPAEVMAMQAAIDEADQKKKNSMIYIGAGVVASLGVLGIVLMNRK